MGLEEPNFVFSRLGPVASGGRALTNKNSYKTVELAVEPTTDSSCECVKLKQEIDVLKAAVYEYELQDECVQPSRTDVFTYGLVSPYIDVANERYEMPLPFKVDTLANLPNNYHNALTRT